MKFLLLLNKFSSPRAKAHWIGAPRRRRHERLLIALLFLFGMAILSPADFAYWSVLVGGTTAIYLNLYFIYLLVPRKSAHWL